MNHNLSRLEQDSSLNIRSKGQRNPYHENNFEKKDYDNDSDNYDNDDNIDYNQNVRKNNKYVGEITGQNMKLENMDYGMPIRSNYLGKKLSKKDSKTEKMNRFDFSLYDSDSDSDVENAYKINSYDPVISNSSKNYGFSGFNDINPVNQINHGTEKVIPELYGTDPGSFISANLNKFGMQLDNLLRTHFGPFNRYCISSYSVYSIFSALYIVSKGQTENEIYDYFGMISKDNIYEGLEYINQIHNKLFSEFNIKNMIFINNKYPINGNLVKHLSTLVNIQQIATDKAQNEYKIINDYLKRISGGKILPISQKVIENADILCITAGYIKPIWKIQFNGLVEAKFKLLDNKTKMVRMLQVNDGQFDYYQDNFSQILEMKFSDDKISMGIILPKELIEPIIKNSELMSCIKDLRPATVDELYIPCFIQQMKIRLSNLLYQTGLKSVFTQLLMPEFTKPSNIHISDIVQNITVIVTNTSNNANKKYKINRRLRSGISNIRFVADHPFMYYFRLIPTNTILLTGYYT
jgi:serine protease inhibitor